MRTRLAVSGWFALLAFLAGAGRSQAQGTPKPVTLLNVSYDPTRELYEDFNKQFATYWKGKTGQDVTIRQSHGGSGKQARSVIDGLEADVVTLALAYDIDQIAEKAGLLPANWQTRLPEQQLAVHLDDRAARPEGESQGDQGLGRPGSAGRLGDHAQSRRRRAAPAGTIWPPGRGRLRQPGGNEATAKEFVTKLYKNVPVLDAGARGSTTTFVERGIGDVLIAWENEALLAIKELGPGKFEVVAPSLSILAEPPVAVVDKVAGKHGTKAVAQAYLEYLYTPEGQEIAAKNFYRPRDRRAWPPSTPPQFPKVSLVTVDEVFGGWKKAHAAHFADGAPPLVINPIATPVHVLE